jgi:hypothetical protein
VGGIASRRNGEPQESVTRPARSVLVAEERELALDHPAVWGTLVSAGDCAEGSAGVGVESSASASSRCGPAVDSHLAPKLRASPRVDTARPSDQCTGGEARTFCMRPATSCFSASFRAGLLQDADCAVA